MIELQSVWTEIEDELSGLDDQESYLLDSNSSDGLEAEPIVNGTRPRTPGAAALPLPTTDNLIDQFFGDMAYEFDLLEEDSELALIQSSQRSSSLLGEVILVQQTPREVPVPKFDYVTKKKKTKVEVVPASPTSSNSDEEYIPSFRRKKRPANEDGGGHSSSKRHRNSPSTTKSSKSTPPETPRTYLLHLISNVLPVEKLAGVVEIVNATSVVQRAESEEEIELEFDINALDIETLDRLERYVESCLTFTKPEKRSNKTKRKGKRGSSKRLSLAAMGEVLTMRHDSKTDDESEYIDILD